MDRLFLILAALVAPAAALAVPAPALAQARVHGVGDPRAFVAGLYAAYARRANHPPPEPAYAYSRRLAGLFAAAQRWARAHDDLVGALDFDWVVNAQDWDISQVAVTELPSGRGRRIVVARWTNYDRADSSRFAFVRERGRWVLDEVVNGTGRGDDGWTLSALLRERP